MTRKALWQQLDTYPAGFDRQLISAIWPSPGLVNGMGLTVPSGRNVTVAAGSIVVPYGGSLGSALCVSDGPEPVVMPAAPASGSTRIDVICAQVRDAAVDAGTANGFDFVVVSGAASSAPPSPPAIPARAGALAYYTAAGGETNVNPASFYGGPVAHPGGGAVVPIGTVIPYAGPSAPSGWVLCDGTAVSRSLYSALFAVIGTTFGAGDGSTSFNLPDLRSRDVLGAGGGGAPPGLTARLRGQTGGEETHVLASSESGVADHRHDAPGHSYFVAAINSAISYSGAGAGNGAQWAYPTTDSVTPGYLVAAAQGHNNVQPFLSLWYLIKAF